MTTWHSDIILVNETVGRRPSGPWRVLVLHDKVGKAPPLLFILPWIWTPPLKPLKETLQKSHVLSLDQHRQLPLKKKSLVISKTNKKTLSCCYSQTSMFSMRVCTVSCFTCVQFCATPWIVTRQAPLSTGFSRREYWSGLPCPPPGDLPDPGTEPMSLMSPASEGMFFTNSTTSGSLMFLIDKLGRW